MKRGVAACLFLSMFCLLPGNLEAVNILRLEKDILTSILNPDKYDTNIRPQGKNETGGPVMVNTNMYVRSIGEIDDVKMEYSMQLTFRQEWQDSRLEFDDHRGKMKFLTMPHPERIWTPDVFFSNEKSGHFHNIVKPNVLIRIFPNGNVLYSTRISLKLSCPMNLRNYPMDKQMCSIVMASYGYTTDDIVFMWKQGNPVQMKKDLHLPRFKLLNYHTDHCTSKTNTGEYTCLKMDMNFSRELSYYVIQMFIPYTFLVILSWIPFWLDYRATTARVAIWVTILLTMTINTSTIQNKLPAVSYTKAIDVWAGVCLTFLFAVIIELALVTQMVTNEEKKPLMTIDDHGESNDRSANSKLGKFRKWLNQYQSRAQKIDVISRVGFPLAFALFNLFYWSTYVRSE